MFKLTAIFAVIQGKVTKTLRIIFSLAYTLNLFIFAHFKKTLDHLFLFICPRRNILQDFIFKRQLRKNKQIFSPDCSLPLPRQFDIAFS